MLKDKTVNIGDARANFSDLIKRAASGEEIVISKAGVPQARLGPVEKPTERPSGILAPLLTKEQLEALDKYVTESTNKEEDWSEFYADIAFPD